jgi:hypothetical protein
MSQTCCKRESCRGQRKARSQAQDLGCCTGGRSGNVGAGGERNAFERRTAADAVESFSGDDVLVSAVFLKKV